jgi:hypothetical protein
MGARTVLASFDWRDDHCGELADDHADDFCDCGEFAHESEIEAANEYLTATWYLWRGNSANHLISCEADSFSKFTPLERIARNLGELWSVPGVAVEDFELTRDAETGALHLALTVAGGSRRDEGELVPISFDQWSAFHGLGYLIGDDAVVADALVLPVALLRRAVFVRSEVPTDRVIHQLARMWEPLTPHVREVALTLWEDGATLERAISAARALAAMA